MNAKQDTIKLFVLDLNFSRFDRPRPWNLASAPQDWASINPREYFDYHRAIGSNAIFCQAYTHGGYAFYPTKLGPVAPGPGRDLVPRLFAMTKKAGLPYWGYFCVGVDIILSSLRPNWRIPADSRREGEGIFLGPESPWTDLLCARIKEFLTDYPADWMLFDWFVYGNPKPDTYHVQPVWFAEKPFKEIIGRPMPSSANGISKAENLKYKRMVLARQFCRIRDMVRQASPKTRIVFNVPYHQAAEALWVDHPMLNESDALFAECSQADVVNWLLKIRKPPQRVMTTVTGRLDQGACDANSWRVWHEKGCDLFGYAWCTPPRLKPHPSYTRDISIVRRAFKQIK
jgi:hypothetical protein